MTQSQPLRPAGSRRNQSMELFKLFASFMVVLGHTDFHGALFTFVNVVGRVAVPGFFAISGFFSYNKSGQVMAKRIKHIALLTCVGFGVILGWNCFAVELDGGSSIGYLRSVFPDAEEFMQLLILNLSYLCDPMWYMVAALEVYVMVWAYASFFGKEKINYTPLYIVGFCLYCFNLLLGTMYNAVGEHAIFLYRNAIFFGLPMFTLGIFLRQYGARILENLALTDRKLVAVVLAGVVLAYLEWTGLGVCESMLGNCISVVALMLLMDRHPQLSEHSGAARLIGFFGPLSTTIYLIHQAVIGACNRFMAGWFHASPSWLRPLMILLTTIVTAAAWLCLVELWKKTAKAVKKSVKT